MKRSIVFLTAILLVNASVKAQINVGSSSAPDSSAMLQISGTTKGFLPPRMTRDSMYLIHNPARGLIVFNTTDSLLFMHRDSGWVALAAAGLNSWLTTGNGGTNSAVNFIGTTDNHALTFKTNNIYRMHLDSAGGLFVGDSLSSYGNTVSGTNAGLRSDWTTSLTSPDTPRIALQGLMRVNLTPASSSQQIRGFNGSAIVGVNNGVTSNADIYGGYFVARRQTSSTITEGTGTLNILAGAGIDYGHTTTASSGGTTNNVYGIKLNPQYGSGTITNLYGLYVSTPTTTGGTVTNLYDVYFSAQTLTGVANSWGIYQANTKNNYFGGNVGIGTTTPSTKLHIVGTNPLTLTGVQTGTNTSSDSLLTITGGLVRKLPLSTFANSANALSSLNGLTTTTQTFATGTSGIDFNIASTTSTHTFNLPDASSTARGLVTTGTQTIAGSKTFSFAPTFSSFTAGSVPFIGTGGLLSQSNSNLFWDATNSRLGIGTNAPSQKLDVTGNINTSSSLIASATVFVDAANTNSGTTSPALRFGVSFSGEAIASKRTSGGNQNGLDFYTSSANRMSITNVGNVGISNNAPTEKLDVTGNVKFSGALMPNNTAGTAGQVLTSAGAGTPPTWSNTGSVTSVSVTSANGVSGTVVTATTTPAISLTLGDITPTSVAATGTVTASNVSGTNTGDETNATIKTKLGTATSTTDGYLTQADWNTFNNKASTTNVISSLNGLTATTQTFATPGTTGTAPAWSSLGSVHTLNIPLASAAGVTAGLLSNTDWTTFNNKATTTGTWSTTGNAGTTAGTNFIGTTDAQDLVLKANNTERFRIVNGVSSSTGTTGDITIGDATSGTVRSTKEFVMREDGDNFGPSTLRLRNRNNENGAIFETIGASSGAYLVDFIFRTGASSASQVTSNIRFETRASNQKVTGNTTEWQFGQPDVTNGGPTLVVGASGTGSVSSFRIGNVGIGNAAPTQKLDVTGNVKFSGALMPNNTAGTAGQVLTSAGVGTPPTWNNTGSVTSVSVTSANGVSGTVATATTTPAISLTLGDITPTSVAATGTVTGSNLSGTNTGDETNATIKTKLGAATATTDGYLTQADWNTFNSKASTTNSWSTTGNSGTTSASNFLGTKDSASLRFRTSNTQRILIDSLGNIGIGSSPSFTASPNGEKLLVDAGTTNSFNVISGKGNINNYLQLNIQNTNAGTAASSDVVATADNGNESSNYVDLGINSSAYTGNFFGAANDAYLYAQSQNLLMGTASAGKSVVFLTGGGTQSTNERMRIDGSGNVGIGTNAPSSTLVTQANVTNSGVFKLVSSSNNAGDQWWMGFGHGGTSTDANDRARIGVNIATGGAGRLFFTTGSANAQTERMRIDENGNVGIGTTSPATALQVSATTNPLTLTGVQSGATTDSLLTITSAGLVRRINVSTFATPANTISSLNGLTATTQTFATGTSGTDFNIASSTSTHTFNLPDASATARGVVTTGTQTLAGSKTFSSAPTLSSLTAGSIPYIGTGGLVSQSNANLFWDATNSRLGVGTSAPASNFTVYQSSGTGNSKGITFTGNSIGGINTGTGFLMTLGYNATSNKQLWLGDADDANNANGTFARFSVGGNSATLDAVKGDNSQRRFLSIGVGGDGASGVVFGGDGNTTHPGSFVWANGTMTIGNGYRSNAAPTNGLLVQGSTGIGITSPTAVLQLAAGTATAGTAPLKLTSGTNLTTPENGAVEYDGTNYFATSGNTRYMLAKTLTATATLDFTSTAAASSSTITMTVTGAADGDAVTLGVPNASNNANSNFTAYVSAANTVTVKFNNYSAAAIDPASGTFRVSVLKY